MIGFLGIFQIALGGVFTDIQTIFESSGPRS
jgi:hypothetical protein